jgi:hypothetical protein
LKLQQGCLQQQQLQMQPLSLQVQVQLVRSVVQRASSGKIQTALQQQLSEQRCSRWRQQNAAQQQR